MKNFLLLFRADITNVRRGTPEEMQALAQRWMDWIGSIASQGKLVDRGNRLEPTGRVVKGSALVTDGPYTEIKESIGGYTLVKAESYDDAVELAKGCPVLTVGGNVEVRELSVF